MEKTEMMKRYESETGKQSAIVKFMAGGQALEQKSYPKLGPYVYSMDYIQWLEAQLTWRPVSEKPERMGMYLAEVRPYMGNVDVIVTTVYFNGESFLGYDDVVRWLPIPPAPEGE